MELQQNSSVNSMTLKCDVDIESVKLSHGFCTPSHREKRLGEV